MSMVLEHDKLTRIKAEVIGQLTKRGKPMGAWCVWCTEQRNGLSLIKIYAFSILTAFSFGLLTQVHR